MYLLPEDFFATKSIDRIVLAPLKMTPDNEKSRNAQTTSLIPIRDCQLPSSVNPLACQQEEIHLYWTQKMAVQCHIFLHKIWKKLDKKHSIMKEMLNTYVGNNLLA